LTALAMAGDRARCIEAGANDYLAKPIRLKELNLTIQRWLTNNEDGESKDYELN
jgi:CheY-like chemotaxis protein